MFYFMCFFFYMQSFDFFSSFPCDPGPLVSMVPFVPVLMVACTKRLIPVNTTLSLCFNTNGELDPVSLACPLSSYRPREPVIELLIGDFLAPFSGICSSLRPAR